MLRKDQKGQGLTEFALILPLLLLVLLGVIEAARVIWAYVTVQQAAREAVRYAVTGRPYLDVSQPESGQYHICRGDLAAEPDPVSVAGAYPWLCPDERFNPNSRVHAVKEVALTHGRNLAVSQECTATLDTEPGSDCWQQPGAFGVRVVGQIVSGTEVITDVDIPGTQGLNIQVNTFYNLEMITPIYNVVMGGNFLRLQGSVQMQNEGLDATIGIQPPPGIGPPPTPENTGGDGPYSGTPGISSVSGYRVNQSDVLRVKLENHANDNNYDIYLRHDGVSESYVYQICANVATTDQGTATVDCNLALVTNGPVEPEFYDLYSTIVDTPTSVIAQDDNQVEVTLGGAPQIIPEKKKYVWAANTPITLTPLFHNLADGPFDIKLYDKDGNYVETIATAVSGASSDPVSWTVYDMETNNKPKCDQSSGDQCIIRSHRAGQVDTYAEMKMHINQPQILLSDAGPDGSYARGELVYVYLVAHTPRERYNVRLQGQTSSDETQFDSLDTDDFGNTPTPIAWIIPEECGGLGGGWPNGQYDFTSHPLGEDPQIAIKKDVTLYSDPNPRLSVEGGQTWPAGSVINIRVHLHEINDVHYLEFDGQRVPTPESNDTFLTGNCGEAVVSYQIPFDTQENTYTLASYLASDNSKQAELEIIVLKQPIITVLEGNIVLPDDIITIQLYNHTPNTGYNIVYNDVIILSVFTDAQGRWSGQYDLTNLPPGFASGVPYFLESQTTIAPFSTVAQTILTLQYADLEVTKVEIPDQIEIGTSVPVTVTIRNNTEVPIDRWVDFDFYFLKHPEPDPVVPTYYAGYNFPGDVKYWRSAIGPLEEFTFTTPFSPTEFGLQSAYGYADTSNFVFEGEQQGQVSNPNNINSKTFLVPCTGVFVDDFSTDYADSDAIPGWSTQTYGDADRAKRWTSGGELYLESNGSSTWRSDDRDGGYMFLYRDSKLSSSSGLNVVAQLTSLDLVGDSSKAGIEVRGGLGPDSAKVVLGVSRLNGTSELFIQPGYRQTAGASMAYFDPGEAGWQSNHRVNLSQPIWLRIEREQTSDGGAFKLYYKQSNQAPPAIDDAAWWGAAKATQTVSGLGDEVFVGLFNASYSSTEGQSTFGQFAVSPDPALCTSMQPDVPIAPGYQVCHEGLQDRSFEKLQHLSEWKYALAVGVARTNDAYRNGNFSLRASSFDGTDYNPYFSQQFVMPDWVISDSTTFDFDFFKRIRSLMGSTTDRQADKFYAAVVTSVPGGGGAPPAGTVVAGPIEIVTGESSAGAGSLEPDWIQRTVRIPVATGVNLEDYANQALYLYLYNNSNALSACAGSCATQFHFDDASLQTCTMQPLPETITSRITGKLTLHFDDTGQTENPAGVKVWAYAPDDRVFETFTIQGGEFNFYNLPATVEGIEYILYSQYVRVQTQNQMEILAGDSTVLLKSANDNSNPVQTFLDLHTLADPF